jgi:hypothetical protein
MILWQYTFTLAFATKLDSTQITIVQLCSSFGANNSDWAWLEELCMFWCAVWQKGKIEGQVQEKNK